ncbi:preprotein translocase subunit SecD [Halorhabdus sp. BNX81]|uniref:preprotein translocase subunit SecD n=1 Tax=Halorhabdus sp. BNX81 TaxID=2980181 RepID=UPI0023DD2AD5|nr:preprotein translocase subunit SecD [Halorhabdus sp. BNX81]WEL21933.1 Preprotein translocase subunit SecD [Halorhabdus sp. BNX81]
MNVRENWRIVLLVVFVLGSAVALFAPVTGGADDGGITNLQYGIQLDGGTSIQAPAVGITAEDVNVTFERENALAANVTESLSADPADVRVSAATKTVEVFTKNVTHDQLRDALVAEGYQPGTVRDGVTSETRERMVKVIRDKITESALSGGSVSRLNAIEGNLISITAPDRDREELQSLLNERGIVRVYAVHPDENGSFVPSQVLGQDEFGRIGTAQEREVADGTEAFVPVTINDDVAERFQQEMTEYGFNQDRNCGYDRSQITNVSAVDDYCLVTTLNGEIVFSGGVDGDLGRSFASGGFATDPSFRMTTGENMTQAKDLEISLRAGRLPAPLDFENANYQELEPALGQQFRTDSLITGIMAVLAVSGMIFLRYQDVRVALPMIVTAMSEVFVLLGFVALVQYPLNLSHIAGFIAVIGTGADDLIIIADEILQREEIATDRVFQNRFRKAFWVIGAAAATTIIAMSPLTVLGLGDLSGFAIITIVGVLIGVLVTRPAYGNFLRRLVLDE